jgi:hypothetical protein
VGKNSHLIVRAELLDKDRILMYDFLELLGVLRLHAFDLVGYRPNVLSSREVLAFLRQVTGDE